MQQRPASRAGGRTRGQQAGHAVHTTLRDRQHKSCQSPQPALARVRQQPTEECNDIRSAAAARCMCLLTVSPQLLIASFRDTLSMHADGQD